jgi:multidrug efflux pump subunit AcrA (membrane-fusion protein)
VGVLKKLLILLPIALGVVVLVVVAKGRKGPERVDATETARAVRVVTVQPRDVVPKALAYGTVRSVRRWSAVAEISGQIAAISPLLKEGEIVPPGTEILRIDDTDAKLEVARLEADAEAYRAQLARLEASKSNYDELLKVERRSHALAQRELERLEGLLAKGSVAESDVDQQRRAVLAQSASIVNYENSLRLLPSERKQVEAQLKSTEARLQRAQRDVERAVIRTPFACRIDHVAIEKTQPVSPGQVLAEAYDIAASEVEARVAMDHARRLFDSEQRRAITATMGEGVPWDKLGIGATLRLRLPGATMEWQGRFVRAAASLASATRAVGIVVAVDQPYLNAKEKPPLVKGMFVEVELTGPPRKDRIVVPRHAVHAGKVYVLGAENRLEIRPVEVSFRQGEEAILRSGVKAGDRIVVSDLVPAIRGMLLDPQE